MSWLFILLGSVEENVVRLKGSYFSGISASGRLLLAAHFFENVSIIYFWKGKVSNVNVVLKHFHNRNRLAIPVNRCTSITLPIKRIKKLINFYNSCVYQSFERFFFVRLGVQRNSFNPNVLKHWLNNFFFFIIPLYSIKTVLHFKYAIFFWVLGNNVFQKSLSYFKNKENYLLN